MLLVQALPLHPHKTLQAHTLLNSSTCCPASVNHPKWPASFNLSEMVLPGKSKWRCKHVRGPSKVKAPASASKSEPNHYHDRHTNVLQEE